jgi:hypothetical protein
MQHSNKVWKRRLDVVLFMEKWVALHLKPRGAYDCSDRPHAVLMEKGKEYFYGHLFWGRMCFPGGSDPLFADYQKSPLQDTSIQEQLVDGAYGLFVETLARCRRFYMDADARLDSEVTVDDVEGYAKGGHFYSKLKCELWSTIGDRALRRCILVSLILRYRCVGGFESNLHGSVPMEWGYKLGGFIECFASPLNRKFYRFYSFFEEEDEAFGAEGDFFRVVAKNGGVLPPGDYQINPPFHEGVLNYVADIVKLSLETSYGIRVVMVVPNWKDAPFIDTLNSARCVGRVFSKRYDYCHFNGGRLCADTLFYIMVDSKARPRGDEDLFSTCEHMIFGRC